MQQSEGVKEAMLRFYDRSSAYDVGSFDRLVSQKHESMVIGTAPTSGLTTESSGDRPSKWKESGSKPATPCAAVRRAR
jgi:hypothetical protein